MSRTSIKIVGASGQGINSIGEILARGLKRAGYCVFGYRAYPSLIKGGHASYQLDIAADAIASTEQKINLLVTLNHHGFEHNLREVKDGGVILHQEADWKFSAGDQEYLTQHRISVIEVPVEAILTRLKAKAILGNVLLAAVVWALLKQKADALKERVTEQFANKKDLLTANMQCIDEGVFFAKEHANDCTIALPKPQKKWKNHLLITGSQAMGLGAVHAGVRLYAGYPMTPSSPLLSFMADLQNRTGMVIKQAEDEITAAQMVSGAMFMGTRALTATSGGGFDLMSETLSMNGIIENPTVFVLAQRPGPATGLPTWTAQGDLLMAVHTAHGEFARCVLSVSDGRDAFDLMPIAFNIAERYQISVIVLTEKQIAEALYTQEPFDQGRAVLDRGHLITDPKKLVKLTFIDRYDPAAADGISPRWLPGSEAAVFCAQADEHDATGTVDETAANTRLQFEKRLKKAEALKKSLPEPLLYRVESGPHFAKATRGRQLKAESDPVDILLVGWGSTKSVVVDVMWMIEGSEGMKGMSIGYLHYTYLWPLKTEKFEHLAKAAKRVILIEGNYQGQLGMLIRQECGFDITEKILKYDGRPFFYDELLELLQEKLAVNPTS